MINNISIKPCVRLTSSEEITELEKYIKANLPEDYKGILLKYNGGKPEYFNTFNILDLNTKQIIDGSNVKSFFGIEHPIDVINIYWKLRVFKNRVPKELLPIANDSSGNLICLGIKGEHYNKVYFWDHENEVMDESKGPWWENIGFIADSFEEFINNLYYYELDDNDQWISKYQDGTVVVEDKKHNIIKTYKEKPAQR